MPDLLAARLQMALSLAFHIGFAVVGIGMPLLMIIAEAKFLRTGQEIYRTLAKRWAKGTAVLFAVGAVSGTVLSFELGLLWPEFMAFAGPIFGLAFSLEGFAFFLEAIFFGIYLYGWDKVPPRAHWFAGFMVFAMGTLSGVFVTTANAWMNTPAGFEMVDGQAVNIDPVAAMMSPAAFTEVLHVTLSAFLTLAFMVAAIHAYMLLKKPDSLFHRTALAIALPVGAVMAVLMPVSGDLSAKHVAAEQPVKFAAMEAHWETGRAVPAIIGGWPDEDAEETRWAVEIPYLMSFLATGDPQGEVRGLKDFPADERPPVAWVHLAFQVMVGGGLFLMAVGLLGGFLTWRQRALPLQRWYLKLLVVAGPVSFVAMQAGWLVTELGRQPWVVRGIMRTSEGVTPMPRLWLPLVLVSLVYLLLTVVVIVAMRRLVLRGPGEEGDDATA